MCIFSRPRDEAEATIFRLSFTLLRVSDRQAKTQADEVWWVQLQYVHAGDSHSVPLLHRHWIRFGTSVISEAVTSRLRLRCE